uniref:Uncharacterized protein n=1 Tax=Ascaris lumbricoides TaxID=6252 RepID=A0A0M3I0I5_ASCLU
MRVPISDIANASRKTPSFRSRSPSIRPVFKDMRNYELDVQHIVHGLLKRAREERDDPKFAGRQKSRAEECPDLLTATSIESELQSEVLCLQLSPYKIHIPPVFITIRQKASNHIIFQEDFEREINIDPDNA